MDIVKQSLLTKIAAGGINADAGQAAAKKFRDPAENFKTFLKQVNSPTEKVGTPPPANGESDPRLSRTRGGTTKVTPELVGASGAGAAQNVSAEKMTTYKDILNEMSRLAQITASPYHNYSQEQRAEWSAKFEELSHKLNDKLQESGLYDEPGSMTRVGNMIGDLDIGSREGALEAFHRLDNLGTEIAQLRGETPPGTDGNEYEVTLQHIINLTNQASNYMTDTERAQLNIEYKQAMEKFWGQLGGTNHLPAQSFYESLYAGLDISTEEGAQRAFMEMKDLQSGLDANRDMLANAERSLKRIS